MRFEGECIVIENRPVPLGVRIFTFAICFPVLCIGLRALYNIIVQVLTGLDEDVTVGGFAIGIALTVFSLAIPAIIMRYAVLEPYKTLRLDPRTRQGNLIRRYLFTTRESNFAFSSIAAPSVFFRTEGSEESAGWVLILKLPDKTTLRYEAVTLSLSAQKAFAEEWEERINTMLKPA